MKLYHREQYLNKPNLHSWASWRGSQLPELGFF